MTVPEWLTGCMEVEVKMSELYGLLAGKFLKEELLFKTLSIEEESHYQTLGLVEPLEEMQSMELFQEARVLTRTMQAVEMALNKIRYTPMQLEEALKLTISLEEGLVENFLTSIATLAPMDAENRIKVMQEESSRHADMLRDALMRNGFMYNA